ncbi:MAG: transglycosylase SLT domain-containing protein [Acidobacteria bacterium]|nr:transglycosylase SLT domain-containing protein [Acidobacteriota bacterium]
MKNALLCLSAILTLCTVGCIGEGGSPGTSPAGSTRDLENVLADGRLNVILTWDSTSYFLYRGEPLGYEYELVRRFASDHGLTLSVDVLDDRSQFWPKLKNGDGDLAAGRIFRMTADEEEVAFSKPLYVTPPVVVQRGDDALDLPEAVDDALEVELEAVELEARVARVDDLSGRSVHMPRGAQLNEVVIEVSDEISGDIHLVVVKGASSVDPLIRRVATGKINLTVAPQNVAELKDDYYTNLIAVPTIGPRMSVVWAFRRNSTGLRQAVDRWLDTPEIVEFRQELYTKYFEDREGFRERVVDEYLTSETGQLSPYDDLFRKHAADLGWDWRLLASQAFQESRFEPKARSWAGAMGLLQLMPRTAREVGVRDAWDPEENVGGAVRYLLKLEKAWEGEISDPDERLKFILASYNAGRGHVLDAQRLAEKNGDDPALWDDVAYWMLQKSKRQYFTDPVVRYGFVRGLEPVTYVDLILSRYDHYREFVN